MQEQMSQCGGTDVMVQQLSNPRPELQLCAAEALKNLCTNPPIALAAVKAGVLPILNHLRHTASASLLDAVAGILSRMSIHAGTRPYLASEQSIPTLIALLPREARDERSPSLCALMNVARGNPANCNLVVSAGGMQVLLDSCASQVRGKVYFFLSFNDMHAARNLS